MPVYAPQMPKKLAKSAFVLFSQRGIRNVNLDEIAAHAGVTKGSLYWHYKTTKSSPDGRAFTILCASS
jgi:AcrR family transcriptional regulator